MERGAEIAAIEKRKEAEREVTISKLRLKSMIPLCDAIRSICSLRRGRSTFIYKELLCQLAVELQVPKEEIKIRVNMMAEIVPEFITIFPPDDIVGKETIRVNLYTPYVDLRKKLGKL